MYVGCTEVAISQYQWITPWKNQKVPKLKKIITLFFWNILSEPSKWGLWGNSLTSCLEEKRYKDCEGIKTLSEAEKRITNLVLYQSLENLKTCTDSAGTIPGFP